MKAAIAAACVVGILSQYAPGVFERVVATRQAGLTAHSLPPDVSMYDGYMAVVECQRIGESVVVEYAGHAKRLLIADCSGHASTTRWMQSNNILGEIDYMTAVDFGVAGRAAKDARVCNGDMEVPDLRAGGRSLREELRRLEGWHVPQHR